MVDDYSTKFMHLLNPMQYENFSDFRHVARITGIFADSLNNKILYVLYLCRFSNPYELRDMLRESSRAVITHRFEALINNGLIDLKGRKEEDYALYRQFWEQQHPRTRGEFPFFIPTEFTDCIMEALHMNWSDIINDVVAQTAQHRGDAFKRYYDHQIENERERQRKREQAAMESIGVCERCSMNITQETEHHLFRGHLFCKTCMREIQMTGEWKQIAPQG